MQAKGLGIIDGADSSDGSLNPTPSEPSETSLETNVKDNVYGLKKSQNGPRTPSMNNVHGGSQLRSYFPSPVDMAESPLRLLANMNPVSPNPMMRQGEPLPSPSAGSSVLPRRSRGFDFARASTTLHQSTLADHAQPEQISTSSKPLAIPASARRGSSIYDMGHFEEWKRTASPTRTPISASLRSVSMMDEAQGLESVEDDIGSVAGMDDDMQMTPQPARVLFNTNGGFNLFSEHRGSLDVGGPISPTFGSSRKSLLARRTRPNAESRKSSSSTSRQSSMASVAQSPVGWTRRNSEPVTDVEMTPQDIKKRRESLSLGTSALDLSDGLELDEQETMQSTHDSAGLPIPAAAQYDERRNVMRRAVVRRSNMLPKPKTLARIRAALMEESSPGDAESRREAEVVRQVREQDFDVSRTTTAVSSPHMRATTPTFTDPIDELAELLADPSSDKIQEDPAPDSTERRGMWGRFARARSTPPPPAHLLRVETSGSETQDMDTPPQTGLPARAGILQPVRSNGQSATPQSSSYNSADFSRKALGKRRRDDDFDPEILKRRAVSPGLSMQGSPALPSSPMQRENWQLKQPGKRVGMQGMYDSTDGLMKMSIE